MSQVPAQKPRGFLGWLGRQVGFVRKAVKTEVGKAEVIYRKDSVEEIPHPDDPELKLRRTVIDEVVKPEKK